VSGLEVVCQLKSHPDLRTIPVVILTTSEMNQDLQAAYQSGANSYVVKVADFDEFAALAASVVHYWTRTNRLPE
jgi:CheY-like chemotaxis protein